jgi:hypothetical protein
MRTVGYSRPFSEKYSISYGEIYSMAVRPGKVKKGFTLEEDITLWVYGQIESYLAQKKA